MVSIDAPAPAGLRLAASAGWAHRRVGAESLELFHRCPSADLPQGRDGAGRNAIDTNERQILFRFVFIRPRASGGFRSSFEARKSNVRHLHWERGRGDRSHPQTSSPSLGERKISAGGSPFDGLLV